MSSLQSNRLACFVASMAMIAAALTSPTAGLAALCALASLVLFFFVLADA